MVSFNVYRSTSSGAYVEGVCLATDEKPVVGIANGSILFAVDTESGETTRYMYDQSSMSWIEAACPCGGGSGGSGGGGSGGIFLVGIVPGSNPATLTASYNDIKAAYDADKVVVLKSEGIEDGITGYAENLITSVAFGEVEGVLKYMARAGMSTYVATSPDAPMSAPREIGPT